MGFKSTMAAGLMVTFITSSVALANGPSCNQFSYYIGKLQGQISEINYTMRPITKKRDLLFYKIVDRESQLKRAHRILRNAQSSLSTLNNEFNNGPYLIEKSLQTIQNSKNSIITETIKAKELQHTYEAISNSFFKKIKKALAKRKWKKQLNRVDDFRDVITRQKAYISHIENVKRNFSSMEFTAEGRIHRAQDGVYSEQNRIPSIATLQQRKQHFTRQERSLENRKRALQAKLKVERERKAACEARNQPPVRPQR